MSKTNTPLRIQKRLLQYNQLVFSFGWITNPSYTSSFKGATQPYTNAEHGGYFPTLGEFGKLNVSEFSAEIAIDFKDVDCEDRVQFARYIKRQLAKSGKLWATQNGEEVIWANARVTSINEVVNDPAETDKLRLNVTFELVDGYWHIAKTTRTFICMNFCNARFKDFDPYYCVDGEDLAGQCGRDGSSKCYPCISNLFKAPVTIGCYDKDTPMDKDDTIKYHPLCYFTKAELRDMFSSRCPNNHYIDYSCQGEADYFCYDASWGKKFRLRADDVNNNNVTRFTICSKSDLPTTSVRIRVSGDFDGRIVIRQLDKEHLAEYEKIPANTLADDKYVVDSLTVGTDALPYYVGDAVTTLGYGVNAYYSYNKKNPDTGIIEIVPARTIRSNTPAFEIQPGINVFEVSGNKYGQDAFVYVETIDITY